MHAWQSGLNRITTLQPSGCLSTHCAVAHLSAVSLLFQLSCWHLEKAFIAGWDWSLADTSPVLSQRSYPPKEGGLRSHDYRSPLPFALSLGLKMVSSSSSLTSRQINLSKTLLCLYSILFSGRVIVLENPPHMYDPSLPLPAHCTLTPFNLRLSLALAFSRPHFSP